MRKLAAAEIVLGLCVVAVGLGSVSCRTPESGEALESASSIVTGKVSAASGEAPKMAHVHLRKMGERELLRTVEAAADGTFSITVPGHELLELEVTAVDHEKTSVPIVSGAGEEIAIEVTLAANRFDSPLGDVRIFGDWNQWRFRDGPAMERRDDGTRVYVVDWPGESVAYQLIGAAANGRTVNGTDSDAFEYDGAGDYRSIVQTDEGRAVIVFDPAAAPDPGDGHLPRATSSDPLHSRMFEIDSTYERARAAGDEASPEVYDEARAVILAALDENAVAPLRAYAAVRLLSGRRSVFTDEERMAAVAALPADSPFWTISGPALAALDSDRHAAVLDEVRRQHPSAKVRGWAVASWVRDARKAGDEARWRELFAELEGYARESGELRSLVVELSPDRRIEPGKPVPRFDVALLDPAPSGAARVSNESLEGSYYLIDFWATWCGPCIQEMPQLHEAWDEYRDRGFQILSVSLDETAEVVPEFREGDWAMPWLHSHEAEGLESGLARSFEVRSLPSPILVDPQGEILAAGTQVRGEKLLAKLAEAIGK